MYLKLALDPETWSQNKTKIILLPLIILQVGKIGFILWEKPYNMKTTWDANSVSTDKVLLEYSCSLIYTVYISFYIIVAE